MSGNQFSGKWRSLIRATLRPFVEFAVILCLVIAIQAHQDGYRRDIATHPDEAAHFVTAVMIHDYLVSGFNVAPMPFAEDYYQRYPKIALGHWPPAFYVLQAVWYLCVGVSKASATLLIGVIAAALVWSLYRELLDRHSLLIVLLTLAVLICQPLVWNHLFMVMSDLATCLPTVLAVFAFGRFLEKEQLLDILLFAVWSVLAILMRPSAMALSLFVPICIVLTGRISILKSWKLWLGGIAVGVFTAPWYLWAWNAGMGLHSHGTVGRMVESAVLSKNDYHSFDALLSSASSWLVAVSILGVIVTLKSSRFEKTKQGRVDYGGQVATSLCLATIAFLLTAPISSGARYYLPALISLVFLYAYGLSTLLQVLQVLLRRGPKPKLIAALLIVCLAMFAVFMAPGGSEKRVSGYATAAEKIPDACEDLAVLVSSHSPGAGAIGEGALIVERLLRDRSRSGYVLRATKLLAESGWSNGRYRLKCSTPEQIRDYLITNSIRYIVVDDYIADQPPPHHQLLKDALRESPEEFRLISKSPILLMNRQFEGAISIYQNLATQDRYSAPSSESQLTTRQR